MAVKKKLEDGYYMKDLFDTQDALDDGTLGNVTIPYTSTYEDTVAGGFLGLGTKEVTRTSRGEETATASTLGSILGKTEEIDSNRRRRKEQKDIKNMGFSQGNSILGGAGF